VYSLDSLRAGLESVGGVRSGDGNREDRIADVEITGSERKMTS
jgi:hypothetical protein